MSRAFRFRLDTLLRVRRIEQTRAEEVLASRTRELRARLAAAQAARTDYEALTFLHDARSSVDFIADREHAERLVERWASAETAVAEAHEEHALAREQMVAALQRVSALERLEQRRRREWVDEVLRTEAAELDDVVSARTAASRMGAGHD